MTKKTTLLILQFMTKVKGAFWYLAEELMEKEAALYDEKKQ